MKQGTKVKHKANPDKYIKSGLKPKYGINTWVPWVVAALLLIITWFLYKPSLNNHFTNWDDPSYVQENIQVRQPGIQSIKYFFTHESATNYHPFTMLSLSLDYQMTVKDKRLLRETDELEAVNFHTTSLVFHLINVLLVFLFIFLLTGKRVIVATVTALLFAIHPMHVESVAWIAERKDVLYTFFFIAGLIVYLKYLEKQSWMRLLLTGILFLASLFSKPSAVVFPLILLAIDYFKGRKITQKVFYEKIPFLILAVVFGVITFMVQANTAVAGIKVFTFFQRLMFASYGFIMYQFKLLLPLKIAAFYPYPHLGASGNLPLVFYLSPLVVAVIISLVYFSTRFTRVFAFGYLFYFFCIMLVLQFMPVGSAIIADRYSYMSSIGLFFIMAWYLDQAFLSRKKVVRSAGWILAGLCLLYSIFLGKTAYEQTLVWQDPETLWTDVISKYPEAEISYKNRGNYYGGMNMPEKALRDFLSYINIKTDDAEIYSNLGNTYGMLGDTEKSLAAYSKSISLDSLNPKPFINRAITYTMVKQFIPALADYDKALVLSPESMDVYSHRYGTYMAMDRNEEAIADLSRLIRFNPRNDIYFMSRGVSYYKLTRYKEALADFGECIAMTPENGNAYYNIGATYNEMKDYSQAYQYVLKAKSLNYPVDDNFLAKLKQNEERTSK
jgi:protein O-mannosyl-transferase